MDSELLTLLAKPAQPLSSVEARETTVRARHLFYRPLLQQPEPAVRGTGPGTPKPGLKSCLLLCLFSVTLAKSLQFMGLLCPHPHLGKRKGCQPPWSVVRTETVCTEHLEQHQALGVLITGGGI